jgi:GWxTD domain-containing protein
MKSIIFILTFFIYCTTAFTQNSLRAYLDVKTFQSVKNESYIEIFNKINSIGLQYRTLNNKSIAKVLITNTIFKNDSIVFQRTDTLFSTAVLDSFYNDIYGLKTIFVKPGKYKLKVDYLDLFNKKMKKSISNELTFEIFKIEPEKLALSNIQIADYINTTKNKNQFSKYGFDVFPHLGNYLSNECSILPFYYEIYSMNSANEKVKIEYKIIQKETNQIFYQSKDTNIFIKGFVTPVAHAIDIKELPTGTYDLTIYFESNKNSANNKFEFYRYNDIVSSYEKTTKILDPNFHKSLKNDSLAFYAKSLMPIMYNEDQKILLKLLKENDSSKIRNFIESFWISTSPLNTFEEWLKYKKQVVLIEKLYKTHNVHGYETERGRVYLKYGPPTAIKTKETSPSEYPYEIWQYDKIKNFSNKRFVFYNPDIVGNNYRLLHSDMLGEIKNFKWPGLLTKRNNSTINVDDPLEGGFDHFGGQSRDVYNQY